MLKTTLQSLQKKIKSLDKTDNKRLWIEFALTEVMPKIKKITKQKDYGYHGLTHTEQVVLYGIDYALSENINPIPVILACALHDCARTHDAGDKGYGQYGHAALCEPIAREFLEKYDFDLSKQEKNQVIEAIKWHTDGTNTQNKIAACLWDADRTRLAWEYGYVIEENFSTKRGLTVAHFNIDEQEAYIAQQTKLLECIDAPSYLLMQEQMYPKVSRYSDRRELLNDQNAPCVGTDDNPLIMYHGTPYDLAGFLPQPGFGNTPPCVDFTPDISYAINRLISKKNVLCDKKENIISSIGISSNVYRSYIQKQYGTTITHYFDLLHSYLLEKNDNTTTLSEHDLKKIISREDDFVSPQTIKETEQKFNPPYTKYELPHKIDNINKYLEGNTSIPQATDIMRLANIPLKDMKTACATLNIKSTQDDPVAFNKELTEKWKHYQEVWNKENNTSSKILEHTNVFRIIYSYINALNNKLSQDIFINKFKGINPKMSKVNTQTENRVYKVELRGIFPKINQETFKEQGIDLPIDRICKYMNIDYPIEDKKTFLKQSVDTIKKFQTSELKKYTTNCSTELKELNEFLTWVDVGPQKSSLQEENRMKYIPKAETMLKKFIENIPLKDIWNAEIQKSTENFTKLVDGYQKSGDLCKNNPPPHYSVFNMDSITIKTRYTLNKERDTITRIEHPNSLGHFAPEPEKKVPQGQQSTPQLTPQMLAEQIRRYL